ncbi:hypothetical protein BASA81_013741 [Batrachochytrium salamandrivorans]|nr:hypothetical protein BASA81_013741 [Batrachochytrium salamandrivorans]
MSSSDDDDDEEEEQAAAVEEEEDENGVNDEEETNRRKLQQQIARESDRLYLLCKDGGVDTIRTKLARDHGTMLLSPKHLLAVLSSNKRSEQIKAAIFDILYSQPELWAQMPNDFYVLHMCAEFDLPSVLELCFKHKLSPMFELDSNGETVLHVACRNDCVRTLKRLHEVFPEDFDQASKVRSASGVLCFDLTSPNSSEVRDLFLMQEFLLPRVFGNVASLSLLGKVSCGIGLASQLPGEIRTGRFRRGLVVNVTKSDLEEFWNQCDEWFGQQLVVIDILPTVVSIRRGQGVGVTFPLRPPSQCKLENDGTWQDEFYKSQTGRLGFRQVVSSQLAPCLRAMHPTTAVVVNVPYAIDYLLPSDLQLVVVELAAVCELCCQGRFLSTLSNLTPNQLTGYLEALSSKVSPQAVLEEDLAPTHHFYLEEKSRKSKRTLQRQQQQQLIAQEGSHTAKMRKRKMDDTLAFDFCKRLRQEVPGLFLGFAKMLQRYQTGGEDSNEVLRQIRDLFVERRDLLDSFNALLVP